MRFSEALPENRRGSGNSAVRRIRLTNDRRRFGLVSILLHWLMALLIIGLFPLGLYMTSLNYYDPWYVAAPDLHRSLGIVMGSLLIMRLLWRGINPPPEPIGGDARWLQRVAAGIHGTFYLLLFAIALSGYLISTADGRGIEVFGWFSLPALIPAFDNMEDVAGEIHWLLAVTLMALVGLHVAAALKHHFIDRDLTLMRMLRIHRSNPDD